MDANLSKYLAGKQYKLQAAEAYRNKRIQARFGVDVAAQQAVDNPIAQRLDKIITGQDNLKNTPLLEELVKIRNLLPLPSSVASQKQAIEDSGRLESSDSERSDDDVVVPKGAAKEYKPNIIPMEIANVLNKQDSESLVDLRKMDQAGNYKLGDSYYHIRGDKLVESGASNAEFKLTPGLASLLTRKTTDAYNVEDYNSYLDILEHSGAEKAILSKGRGRKTTKEIQMHNELFKRKNPNKTPPTLSPEAATQIPTRVGKVTLERKKPGGGVPTVFLPSNPKKLMRRLDILVAEAEAGNKNGLQEASTILDQLKVGKKIYSQVLKKFN